MIDIQKEIIKLVNKGWDVTFAGNEDTIRNYGPIGCHIHRRTFEGDGYAESPLEALVNAIADIHEDDLCDESLAAPSPTTETGEQR